MTMLDLIRGDKVAERVVPPTGFTALLSIISAAAMAFIAVFVLALATSAGRQAVAWESTLDDTATVRISAPAETLEAQAEAVEVVLSQTPGVGATRRIDADEQARLLAPWFGSELPLDKLRLPILIEVSIDGTGPDVAGLKQRFSAEAPGAIYDDHARWRAPLVDAARSLRNVSVLALVLVAGVTAVTIALAASAALAANGQVIDVLRLVGVEDSYITRAFVRRFTIRAFIGALVGALAGLIAVAILPGVAGGGTMSDVGFRGAGWVLPLTVPVIAAVLAFVATHLAARRRLGEVS
ncbi:MAG: cell division protein FtsX [Boseongicola sp.]|nr:MAG: cell division protein FtsX [Boseongicola sp.]